MSKASRHLRACPAAGKEITSRDCGENRGSLYACPADCPHNPWAPENYALGLEIDDRLSEKMMARQEREDRAARPPASRANYFGAPLRDVNAYWCFQFFFERNAEGRTFVERWQKQRFQDLGNDERVLLGHLAALRPTVIEVQRIIDDESFEIIDLLDDKEERLLVRDRSMASRVLRFSAFLVWLARLPHYGRMIGIGMDVPSVQDFSPDEVVRETARHLGAPDDPAALTAWLAANFEKMCNAFTETGIAMRQRTFEQLDARYYKTGYRLLTSQKACMRRIGKRGDVAEETVSEKELSEGFTKSFTWLESAPQGDPDQLELAAVAPSAPAVGRAILGRVLLGEERIRLEANSTARNAQLRAVFERALAGAVEFTGERIDDIGAQVLKNQKSFDPALVPPALLANARRIVLQSSIIPQSPAETSAVEATAGLVRRYHERWLDEQVPALEGRSPRQAAADPALRPKLVRLAKGIVNHTDRQNQRNGGNEDINWLLEELGLSEIIFDPPPLRAPSPDDFDEDFEYEEDSEENPFVEYPEPPPSPLSEKEFERRLDALVKRHPSATTALDEFQTVAPDVLDAMGLLLGDDLNDNETGVLIVAVVQAYFILVPPGRSRYDIDDLRLEDRYVEARDDLLTLISKSEAAFEKSFVKFFESGRQPMVLSVCAPMIVDAAMDSSMRHSIRARLLPSMLAFITALVDELDCAVGAWKE